MNRYEIKNDADFQRMAERIQTAEPKSGSENVVTERMAAVHEIVETVRERGDEAVAAYTREFDGVDLAPEDFELEQHVLEDAVAGIEPDLLGALKRAYDNITAFHKENLRQSWETTPDDGVILGQRMTPLESAGVYVPGGKAFYPSSVLMNIVPARVAGVSDVIMVSPPSYQGTLHPLVLAAAHVAGVSRVFRIGGAQAIAALAYGTGTIPAVLKITGPGNAYVTAAKRIVSSFCAIDSEAGPSEVVVIADDAAAPAYVAAELLAQAEHDADAVAVLVTPSADLVDRVEGRIAEELETLPRADTIRTALEDFGAAYIVRGLDEAAHLTNVIAPEHLSIQTENPESVFALIKNAGAVMMGASTPVAVTDYYAGPNHILPTGRTARFASPLSAEDFRKVTNYVCYSDDRLRQDAADIMKLARAEELTAHARAVEVRL